MEDQLKTDSNGLSTASKDRDRLGRFTPGNSGRPVGSKNKLRQKVKGFVETNIENLQEYFDKLEPREKIKVLADLMPFCIARLQGISQTDADGENINAAGFDFSTVKNHNALTRFLDEIDLENEN